MLRPIALLFIVAGACSFDEDCSLNGVCSALGECLCDAAWGGTACDKLQLLPASRSSGLHSLNDGCNVSSWGGSVLEMDGIWHMYASEMVNHCGIGSWTANSRIVHATSSVPGGEYEMQDVVFPVFSHEPTVVKVPEAAAGPGGARLALFFTARLPTTTTPCNCTDGSTVPSCETPDDTGATYLSWASAAEGPWSQPVLVWIDRAAGSDSNLAPVILENGTLVGIWRSGSCFGAVCGSWPQLVTASDWRNPAAYVFHEDLLFPEMTLDPRSHGTEDPHVYVDEQGRFHAVFHNMNYLLSADECGAYAYSRDGLHWTYTGVAYNATVQFEDGTEFKFSKRERPHIIQDAAGRITHLSTGVAYGGVNGDAVYTLVQPVRGSSDSYADAAVV